MRNRKLRVTALVVALGIATGLGTYLWRTRATRGPVGPVTSEQKPTPRLLRSPHEALLEALQAMSQADESRFFAVVEIDPGRARDYLRALLEFIQTSTQFRDEFIRVYGRNAWVAVQDPQQKSSDGHAELNILPWLEKKLAWAPTASIQEQGSEVFCIMVGEHSAPGRWIFIRRGEGWRLDGRSLCPTGDEIEKTTATLRSWVGDVRRFTKVIGHSGLRPEDIDVELGRAMVGSAYGIEAPPKRFDINKLK